VVTSKKEGEGIGMRTEKEREGGGERDRKGTNDLVNIGVKKCSSSGSSIC